MYTFCCIALEIYRARALIIVTLQVFGRRRHMKFVQREKKSAEGTARVSADEFDPTLTTQQAVRVIQEWDSDSRKNGLQIL